jgi:ubiquinone/menaquinone biosynthesis C-methylase UbiE
MIAELLARSGRTVLQGIPPDGKEYWAARYWDRDAAEQHQVLREDFIAQKEVIASLLRKYGAHASRVLEFACGTGEFTALAAELTPAEMITALDISEHGLARARARVSHGDLRLVHGDFWADNSLEQADLVMCIDAIHHLGDLRAVLTRLRSFVEPGGTCIGNLFTADHFHEFQRKRYGTLGHLRRTTAFFSTAMITRVSNGRLKTGAYRTQLTDSDGAIAILRSVFGTVTEVQTQRYFMAFVCRP